MSAPARPSTVAVRTVDLRDSVQPLTDVRDFRSVQIFVLWDGRAIGSAWIDNHYQPISAARLREAISSWLFGKLLKTMLARELASNDPGGSSGDGARLPVDIPVSIVVATRDRPDGLRQCLRCLVAQASPRPVEIVVVDNHPASGLTPPVIAEFPGVVLVQEERRGLAYARNKGFLASRGAIVVATDDDVTMPPTWLEDLVAPFADPEVMVVTGNVLPRELDTTAQQLFESYGGLGRGFESFRVVDGKWFRRFRAAVPTWKLGGTANAAFRATIFDHPNIGLLDEALGAGMPTGCSEDTYLFYKVLKASYTIVYEPAAYVWHKHRRDMAALRRQIYDYSKGHVAYHLTTLLRDRDLRALVRLGYELPWAHLWRIWTRIRRKGPYPVSLILTEIAGNLNGPWALFQARRLVRRQGLSRGRA
jgi:glycosyltransferase involved in cell wall biosynthesis